MKGNKVKQFVFEDYIVQHYMKNRSTKDLFLKHPTALKEMAAIIDKYYPDLHELEDFQDLKTSMEYFINVFYSWHAENGSLYFPPERSV